MQHFISIGIKTMAVLVSILVGMNVGITAGVLVAIITAFGVFWYDRSRKILSA